MDDMRDVLAGLGIDPGSASATYLAVADLEAARREFTAGGVKVSEIRHKHPVDDWAGGWQPGLDPARRDYGSAADFSDLDGNTWVIQEIGYVRTLSTIAL